MSNDTIYLRAFFDQEQAALRDPIGVNLADVKELIESLTEKGMKFNKGIISEKEAANFVRKIYMDAMKYGKRSKEVLKQAQEEMEKTPLVNSELEEDLEKMAEERKSLILSDAESLKQLQFSNVKDLVWEIDRLVGTTLYLIGHIKDYANTPEYRKRRNIYMLTKPALNAQKTPILTDDECLKRLESTGFIMQNPRITNVVKYIVKKGRSVLDVFDELGKITGSEMRARVIMIQNMSGVTSTLNTHRPKRSLKT